MAPRTIARIERRWGVRFAPLPAGVEAFRTSERVYVRLAPQDTARDVTRRCARAASYYTKAVTR
jgi:hypothetical protein